MGGAFSPRQICESPDGTIWVLGYDLEFRKSPDANKNVLRHYSDKGMVASFIAVDSIGSFPDSVSQIANTGRSYLHCGEDRVSVYLGPAALYIEVDASSGQLARWNVDMSSVVGSKTHGFLVTDEGRLFVAFANAPDPNGERKHGLYELKATPGSRIASLTAVDGTVTAFDSRVVIAFAGRRTSESQRLFAEMPRRGPCTASTERVTLPIMRNRLRGRKPGRWMTRRAAGTFADDR